MFLTETLSFLPTLLFSYIFLFFFFTLILTLSLPFLPFLPFFYLAPLVSIYISSLTFLLSSFCLSFFLSLFLFFFLSMFSLPTYLLLPFHSFFLPSINSLSLSVSLYISLYFYRSLSSFLFLSLTHLESRQ